MIPSLVVSEIRSALVEYLSTTFALCDDDVREALEEFFDANGDGIFRGPYLWTRTPFEPVEEDWECPLDWIPDGFRPYLHQAAAFEQLSSTEGRVPEPTLVTTGTGSGKTECFLYPILDHCSRMRGLDRHGVKALILYPMNALASDQAGRIAELIHHQPALAGLTAGLYVGEDGRHSSMGPAHLIDRRETLRTNPPDILLTNYKMLDFLLLRREDHELWASNTADTLKYVVLDEFHTYDGAQGTDVAMLLRRLGRTLGMATPDRPLGSTTPVATSATLGAEEGAADELRLFASKVFGVQADEWTVIGEVRQSVEDACRPINFRLPVPNPADVAGLDDDFVRVAAAFCVDPDGDSELGPTDDLNELGDRLLAHPLTRTVLDVASSRPLPLTEVVADVLTRIPEWEENHGNDLGDVNRALARFLWLLSTARRGDNDRSRPLFSVEVQLWIREVSRVLRSVDDSPSFRWLDSAPSGDDDGPVSEELPAVYCRRCGSSGWIALHSKVSPTLVTKPDTIYQAMLGGQPSQRVLISAHPDTPGVSFYDPVARTLGSEPGEDLVPVLVTAGDDEAKREQCPACGDYNAIAPLGTRVASLASVSVSTLFGSTNVADEEQKLLAFTDSVQDASHRSSFFAGRTYRFNIRSLISRVIKNAGELPLSDIGDALFNEATSLRDRHGLVPPDLMRDREVRSVWTDSPTESGLEILRQRLGFEAAMEFGLRSRVGRTLELTATAGAAVTLKEFDDMVGLVREDITALLGEVSEETAAGVPAYVRGLVERIRLRGGIHHPFLDPYVADNGRMWHIWGGRPAGLQPFTPGVGLPLFATTAKGGDFDSLSALSRTPTWFVDWAVRSLGVDPAEGCEINQRVMRLLADQTETVISSPGAGGSTVYGINPALITVTDILDAPNSDADKPMTSLLRCGVCGQRHAAPSARIESWEGAPCLRYRCPGELSVVEARPTDYYRRLYRAGRARRVVTGEHTGLLKRSEREDLEEAFKTGNAPDDPNVIVATPTLELGIDIGDLSAVMLTSVPPKPANYLQRVGRAGRITGNSLITTFARSDSHDLYYLAEPEAMIVGEVRPPNCYLDAPETLRRQYLAYLIDRVAEGTISAPPLERHIGPLIRKGLDEGGFLRALIDTSMTGPDHVDNFLALFSGHLSAETVDQLHEFAAAGIETAIKSAADRWLFDYRQLGFRRDRINETIGRLEGADHLSGDEEADLSDLRGQRSAIVRIRRELANEYSLSGLEQLGLLPNYTLVDDSARLIATLWSKDADGNYESDPPREYVRSASLAIREFAPGNYFYAGGHRHRIDTLEIGTAKEPLYEQWSLCPDCGFGEIVNPDRNLPHCPRCGYTAFQDLGTRHLMLRLKTARSSASEESARVFDQTDDRQLERYDMVTSVDVDPANVSDAWQLVDRGFGAEFAPQSDIRTINLGFSERKGDQLSIAGETRHVTGFFVCVHCGAARDARDDKRGTRPGALHEGWCRARSGAVPEQWEKIVLYHQLTTDAVRVLVPVSMFEVDERLTSFKAALLLGLRRDFGGDPDHLDVITSELPNRTGQGRYRFLVLYDRVPGGTGYLDRLADPDRVQTILRNAREIIARCQCVNEGRRACHRCLLGVIGRREYDYVSRDLALGLLDDLLDNWTVDEGIATVADVPIAKVEESELERRFKVALHDWANGDDRAEVRPLPGRNGRDAFELRFVDDAKKLVARYRIDEQEGLTTSPSTIPDYLIERVDAGGRRVAIYLDGFQFHASKEHNNIAVDAEKRAGLRQRNCWVWNLTWDDVDQFHKAVTAEPARKPQLRPLLSGAGKTAAMQMHSRHPDRIDYDTVDQNPVQLLLSYLRDPADDRWSELACSALVGAARSSENRSLVGSTDVRSVVEGAAVNQLVEIEDSSDPVSQIFRWISPHGLAITAMLAAAQPNLARWTAFAVLDDSESAIAEAGHRDRWRDWLQWANLLQFLGPVESERTGIIRGVSRLQNVDLEDLWILTARAASVAIAEPPVPDTVELSQEMKEELELVGDRQVRLLAESALVQGAPMFAAGHEFNGVPIEAAWPERRVGVTVDEEPGDYGDWDVRPVSRWPIDELLEALKGAN